MNSRFKKKATREIRKQVNEQSGEKYSRDQREERKTTEGKIKQQKRIGRIEKNRLKRNRIERKKYQKETAESLY